MTRSLTQTRRQAPASLHDILVSWQSGRLPYRRALALTGLKTITDLYEAAGHSGVDIRMTMLPIEARAARRATDAIKAAGFVANA